MRFLRVPGVAALKRVTAALGFALLLPAVPDASGAPVTIAVSSPEPAVRFGAEQLAAALRAGGDQPRLVAGRVGHVRVGHMGMPAGAVLAKAARLTVESAAESFSIATAGGGIAIVGRDAAGAMYGGLEAADQARAALGGGKRALAAITAARRAPFLAIRGDSPCITIENGRPSETFYDTEFWRRYLDTLARARYNTLDLQAAIDLTTGSLVNGLALFATPPVFPEAARETEEVRRNVAALRQIVALARDRAIRVMLTNRALEAAIPPARQPAYVTQAVTRLRQAVPGLWAIGHRPPAGEALAPGVLASYAGAARPGARARLPALVAARTGMAVPAILARPFNGDQFGLPYPVEPAPEAALPAGAAAVWQIGGGAAHRVLPFGQVESIRRAVRSCRSGRGSGLLLEPIGAYGPQETGRVLAQAEQASRFRFAFERHWPWYALWGRLAYHPEAPPETLWAEFRARFGYDAGEFIYHVFQYAGRVVPTLSAYHALGTGLRDQAPDLEIANRRDRSAGAGDIGDFLRAGTLDRQVMASPREWAESTALGLREARGGPVDVPHELAWLSMRIRGDVATIEDLKPRSPLEWARLRGDLLALAKLADHYAARISGGAHLALHLQSGDEMALTIAEARLAGARDAWAEMLQALSGRYQPLMEPLKLRSPAFTWEEEGRLLERDIAALAAVRAAYDCERGREREAPYIAHIPVEHGVPTRALRVTATVLSGEAPVEVVLHYTAPGAAEARTLPMTPMYKTDAVFMTTVPGHELGEGRFAYRIEARMGERSTWWPGPAPDHARAVPITADGEAPRVEALTAAVSVGGVSAFGRSGGRANGTQEAARSISGDQVILRARVTDAAGVQGVILHYRALAPGEPWRFVAMTPAGAGYEATAPLPAAGLAYCLDVTDAWGNTAMFPDYRKETPYRVVRRR